MLNSDPVHSLRGEALLEALGRSQPTRAVNEALWMAAKTWLSFGGGLPLERFAGLPSSGPAIAKAGRDAWIRRAANLLGEDRPYSKAQTLSSELNTFVTRGAWRSWAALSEPPEDASELRKCLFFVVKLGNGDVIRSRQIYRILLS